MTIDHVGLFIIVYYDAPIWASFRRERRGAFNKFGYKCVVNAYESIKHFRSISLFIYKVVKTVVGMQVFGRCSMSKSFSFIIFKKWENNPFLLS